MNILITGATGFIGQHLLDEIKDDGHNITIISRNNEPIFWCSNTKFKLVKTDISNKSSLEEAFKERIDTVINLAAELRNANNFILTNIQGVKNIIELSEKYGVKRIIHLSSVGVVGAQYSNKKLLIDERTVCMPKNEYEKTKMESENLLKQVGDKGGIKVLMLRPTNVFGDHHPRMALFGLINRLSNGKSYPFRKYAKVNYVYAGDVAHALRYCINNETEKMIINIGESIYLENFLKEISQLLNVNCKVNYIPGILCDAFNFFHYFGIKSLKRKLRAVSNFVEYEDQYMREKIKYKYGVKTGLKKTIDFYSTEKLL